MFYDKDRWGVSFLDTDSRLPYEEREKLIAIATIMYLNKTREMKVEEDGYDEKMSTNGDYHMIASYFCGQKFTAELDTKWGKSKLEFLVTEYVPVSLN